MIKFAKTIIKKQNLKKWQTTYPFTSIVEINTI